MLAVYRILFFRQIKVKTKNTRSNEHVSPKSDRAVFTWSWNKNRRTVPTVTEFVKFWLVLTLRYTFFLENSKKRYGLVLTISVVRFSKFASISLSSLAVVTSQISLRIKDTLVCLLTVLRISSVLKEDIANCFLGGSKMGSRFED